MAKPPVAEHFFIPGPAGQLQAMLETPAGMRPDADVARIAIVCHPHPLYEGTMFNKVVHTVARTINDLGMPALRFNFRGVQDSAGSYGDIDGEVADLLAVARWVQERWPRAAIWLAGFSFGGLVAAKAANALQAERLIGIAPAVTLLKDATFTPPTMPWLIIQGDADEVVLPTAVQNWVAAHQPGPELISLPGVGHFFHGALAELRGVLRAKLSEPDDAVAVE